MHNIRLLCGDPLSLCHKRRSGVWGGVDPERLQTAMSLYSTQLSCLILMVERNIGQPTGMERSTCMCFRNIFQHYSVCIIISAICFFFPEFSDICHQTTDLHFPDYSEQLVTVLEAVSSASDSREQQQPAVGVGLGLESSSSSQTSEPSTPRGGSPFHHHQQERGGVCVCVCV